MARNFCLLLLANALTRSLTASPRRAIQAIDCHKVSMMPTESTSKPFNSAVPEVTASDIQPAESAEGSAPCVSHSDVKSTASTMSIRDIIEPEQQRAIKKLQADNNVQTDSLLELAKKGLSTLLHWDRSDRLLPVPRGTPAERQIDSHQLLQAMLECASSGDPKRYVAAAIVSCQEELRQYIRLANTWFGLFLWSCMSILIP